MNKLLIIIAIVVTWTEAFSQSVVPLRGDTIRIYKQGGSAELRVENSSRAIKGVGYNVDGNGTLRYKRSVALNDSQIVVGNDTIPIHGVAAPLFFISGSGTILAGNGSSSTPYQYDFGGFLTQSTHLSGSDLYDLFLDSMNSVNIVDDVGNFSSYSSQTHIFSTLGGPSGGSRHQVADLLEMFSGNTANDHISHLNIYPDSVEIMFQSAGAKGGAMFRQNGLFRTKGLPNKATPAGTDSVDVVDINGYHYKVPTSAFGGGSGIIPPNGGGAFRIYSPQIPNFRSIRCTNCTLDTATTGEINITVNASNLFTRQNITTGTSATVTGGNYIAKMNLGSTAATFTLTLPPSGSLADKDIVKVESGGTLTSGTEVTSFTVVDNAGNPIIAAIAPTGIPFNVGEYMEFQWDATVARWYRHQ